MNDVIHSLHNKINIIYGTNTDVGKTHIVLYMLTRLIEKSKSFFAIKPILSGFDNQNPEESDSGRILHAMNMSVSQENLHLVTRYFLKFPLSPDIAAKKEGITVDYEDILSFCDESKAKHDTLIIETAGGVMTPITPQHTMRALSIDLKNTQNILVSEYYLGAIGHILSACECIMFDYIIINNRYNIIMDDFIWSLKNHLSNNIKIIVL